MAERIRSLWQRLLADIHRNPGLWIGVAISAAVLVIAYLAYRHQQNSQQSQVPANGYGFPDYGTATGGSSSGGLLGGYAPSQPASPVTVPTSLTPATPGVAAPSYPAYPSYPPLATWTPTPAAPAAPYSLTRPTGLVERVRGGIAAARRVAPTPRVAPRVVSRLGVVNNPTAAQDSAHRGVSSTSQTTGYLIPTTIRPQTVTTRGRVA